MEYDAVVLVEPGEIAVDASGIRTLYVALSRATQRLTTVGTDPDWHPRDRPTTTDRRGANGPASSGLSGIRMETAL